ncbi:hypothetical protein HDU86_005716 [Geranomyces michiganensis]|nr:hypothetical protein HDU86_005716 [Geranomyces michiganensis]
MHFNKKLKFVTVSRQLLRGMGPAGEAGGLQLLFRTEQVLLGSCSSLASWSGGRKPIALGLYALLDKLAPPLRYTTRPSIFSYFNALIGGWDIFALCMDNHELVVSLGSDNTIARLSVLESLRAELKTNGSSRWQDHTVAGDLLTGIAWTLCDKDQKVAFESFQFLLDFLPTCLHGCEDVVEVAIVPVVIANLGDTKLQIRRQALRVLEVYLQHAIGVDSFLESLVHYGLESEDWRARKESAAAIPSLLNTGTANVKWLPLVSALILRLQDISDAVIKTSLAALRHICTSIGDESLARIVNLLPGLSRQIFKRFETRVLNGKTLEQLSSGIYSTPNKNLSRTRLVPQDSKDDIQPSLTPEPHQPPQLQAESRPHSRLQVPQEPSVLPSPPCSARATFAQPPTSVPSNTESDAVNRDVTFGAIPAILVNELRIKSDWRKRSMAMDNLLRYISSIGEIDPVVPHLSDFVEFMRTLMEDPHFRIAMTALQAFGELIAKAGPEMQRALPASTTCLVKRLGDNKLALRQAAAKVLIRLMRTVNPEPVLLMCLKHIGDENPKIREEVANLVANAILVFPEAGWNYLLLVSQLIDRLDDIRPRVKIATIEVFAIMSAMINSNVILTLVRDMGVNEDTIQVLELRFKDPSLPQLNGDGLIEHVISRSNMTTPLPLSASPTKERPRSARPLSSSKAHSQSAPSIPQPFLVQKEAVVIEAPQAQARGIDRALSASSQSELIDDGQGHQTMPTKPKMPWERPRSNASRFSFHGDVQRTIDENLSSVRRARSFSEAQDHSYGDFTPGLLKAHERAGKNVTPDPSETITYHHSSTAGTYAGGSKPPSETQTRDSRPSPERYSSLTRARLDRADLLRSRGEAAEMTAETSSSKDQLPTRRARFRGAMVQGPTAHFSKTDSAVENSADEPALRVPRSVTERERASSERGVSPAAEVPLSDVSFSERAESRRSSGSFNAGFGAGSSSSLAEGEARPFLHRATTSLPKKLGASPKQDSPASAPPSTVSKRAPASLEPAYLLALQQLRGHPDWNIKVDALETVKTVLEECPSIIIGNLHELNLAVVATVHNLRSSVSKHAIAILHIMYAKLGKAMEADLDLTVGSLMKKVGEGAGFILEEVDKALIVMTDTVSPTRAVAALLLNAEHKNPVVRMRVACLCSKVVTEMSQAQATRYVQSYGDAGKLLTVLVHFLREGMAETRNAAKRIIVCLAALPEFNKALEKVLQMKQANEIREALKSALRSSSGGAPAVPSIPVRSQSKRSIIKPR